MDGLGVDAGARDGIEVPDVPGVADGGSILARDPALMLAGLHLRLGSLALARTELEALASQQGGLDTPGRVDLAEARWRTGDLSGAGEAARSVLATGETSVIALIVAAEAAAGLGRPSEARRLANRAVAATDGDIDPLFAGMARSPVWPVDPSEPVPAPVTLFPTERVVIGGPVIVDRGDRQPDAAGAASGDDLGRQPMPTDAGGPGLWDDPAAAPSVEADTRVDSEPAPEPIAPGAPDFAAHIAAAAADEADTPPEIADDGRFGAAVASLEAGDVAGALVGFGLIVRLHPALAPAVIEVLRDRVDAGSLLVLGDALRVTGREVEARDAFARAVADIEGDA